MVGSRLCRMVCYNRAMDSLNDKVVTFFPSDTIEPSAKQQLLNISQLPFIFKHVAVMPDCHLGKGATVGTVIATKAAIIPAAVGVNIGCGMVAVKTKFFAKDLPDNLQKLRTGIERSIPLGAGAYTGNLRRRPRKELRNSKRRARITRVSIAGGQWPSAPSDRAIILLNFRWMKIINYG